MTVYGKGRVRHSYGCLLAKDSFCLRISTSFKDLTFTLMKLEIDAVIQKYGAEQLPPPPQLFTIANRPGEGNTHLIQKVFRGSFEVGSSLSFSPFTAYVP